MKGVINIIGEIGVDVTLIDIVQQVEKQQDATYFTVNINSVGGYVEEGFSIYKYLTDIDQKVTMNGFGVVASIASVIFLAGDKRRVQNGTEFLIHLPRLSDSDFNTADDFDYISKEMRKIERDIMKFYEKHTSLKGDALRLLLKKETFLDAEQLYDFGFTTSKNALKAVAKININSKKDKMTEKEKLENKRAKTVLEKIKAFFKEGEVVMKIIKTADETDLEFNELGEEEKANVGDKADIDGAPANGEFVLADGRTFVFESGELVEIIEASDGDDDIDEVQKLQDENSELKKRIKEQTTETSEAVAKLKKATKTLRDIEKIQSKVVAKKKPIEKKKNALSGAFDNLRK